MRSRFIISPGASLSGSLKVPGDKSISHRAAILAGLASGVSQIHGFLQSSDCLATLQAMQQLGVTVREQPGGSLSISGCAGVLHRPQQPLDLGNAGTGLRLLAGVLAGQEFTSTLTGDKSLCSRPMRRIIEPLERMGATVSSADGTAPLKISGRRPLMAIDFAMPVASAQVKSCILLAGLFADGVTRVTSPSPVRDHTERMLVAMGAELETEARLTQIRGPVTLKAADISVPGDFSSAAFFLAVAAAMPGTHIKLESIGVNPGRTGLLDILRAMGAEIHTSNSRVFGGEPVADIEVHGRKLHGITVHPALVPAAIDEFPILFVVAALADGKTSVSGAAELRVKESDRIAIMARALTQLGIAVHERSDGLTVEGAGEFGGAEIDCGGDHRVAMALAMAGACAREEVIINNVENVATSYPEFDAHAAALGLPIVFEDARTHQGRAGRDASAMWGNEKAPVITVDGPSGSGKGTVSRLVAKELGWHLLDSGALYRLTALAALDAGIDPGDEAAVAEIADDLKVRFETDESGAEHIFLDGQDVTLRIRSERCGAAASKVARLGDVRRALAGLQLAFRRAPGLVADGRDMGTVVFPDARLKIFLTATAEERAGRRYKQLKEKGIGVSLAALREEIAERDRRDQTREIAPLVPAEDALLVETTGIGIAEVVQQVLAEAKKVFVNAGERDG